MDIASAKKIPLATVLRNLGHEPIRAYKGGAELAYLSPLRAEREPSFFVNVPQNLWYDFGSSTGGDVIELVRILEKTNVRDALRALKKLTGAPDFGFAQTEPGKPPQPKIEEESLSITQIKPFGSNRPLSDYLTKTRRIAPTVAARHLSEIHFRQQGRVGEGAAKNWFAAGFANLAGGWELRNPYFKGSVGGKDISLVVGKDRASAAVFEGFIDFLTVQTAFSLDAPTTDAIVLNSVSHLERAALLIHKNSYENIRVWMDNDNAGKQSLARLIDMVKCDVEPQNHRYLGFNDVNAAFLGTGKLF